MFLQSQKKQKDWNDKFHEEEVKGARGASWVGGRIGTFVCFSGIEVGMLISVGLVD